MTRKAKKKHVHTFSSCTFLDFITFLFIVECVSALTFDLGYELAGSGEYLHGVEQRVGVDDLTQHPQDLSQALVSRGPLTLLLTWMGGGRRSGWTKRSETRKMSNTVEAEQAIKKGAHHWIWSCRQLNCGDFKDSNSTAKINKWSEFGANS